MEENKIHKDMTKLELRQWIIEFSKAPAYPEVEANSGGEILINY